MRVVVIMCFWLISCQLQAQILGDQGSSNPLTNAVLHYRADSLPGDIDASIQTLIDISTSSNNATQNNPELAPTIGYSNVIDSKTIGFADEPNYMDLENIPMTNDGYTIITLLKDTTLSSTLEYVLGGVGNGITVGGIFEAYEFPGIFNGSDRLLTTEQRSLSEWFFIIHTPDTVMFDFEPINSTEASEVVNSLALSRLGARPDNTDLNFGGEIAELVVFDFELSLQQLDSVSSYLYNIYSPDFELPDTISVLPTCSKTLDITPFFSSFMKKRQNVDGTFDLIGESETLTVTDSGLFAIEASGLFGQTFNDTIRVIHPDFDRYENTTICDQFGQEVDLAIDTSIYEVSWDPSTLSGFSVNIDTAGTYSVEVIQGNGCSNEWVFNFANINDIVEIEFSQPLCLGSKVLLNTSTFTGLDYIWNTGSDSTEIVPQESGEYWVEVTNENGCIGRDTVQVDIVGQAPEVTFIQETPCENTPIQFSDITQPPQEGDEIAGRTWEFPEETFTDSTFSTLFSEAGTYPVRLTVMLENGCTDSLTQDVTVNAQPDVLATNPIACHGLPVTYEDLSIPPEGQSIAMHEWSTSTDDAGSGVTFTTSFDEPGEQQLQLISTTTAGCRDTLNRNITVYGTPDPDFTWTSTCEGEPMAFLEQVDTELSGPVTYEWQFGDGFFSFFPNTTHEYANPGTFEVTLTTTSTVIGNTGCEASISQQVDVHGYPTANFTVNDTCAGRPLGLGNQSLPWPDDPLEQWTWTFPNGDIATGPEPQYAFSEPGSYDIQLQVTSQAGCSDVFTQQADILELPTAAFNVSYEAGVPPVEISLENLSDGASTYLWNFGNGDSSTDFEPAYAYPDTGDFQISLTAQNEVGCSDSAKNNVDIIIPYYDLSLVDIRCEEDGGYLQCECLVGNKGNQTVTQFRADWNWGQGNQFSETVFNFSLPPQETQWIPLNNRPQLGSGNRGPEPYVCMTLSEPNGPGNEDQSPEDNNLCEALSGGFEVFAPYPNPATDDITVQFNAPGAGAVEILTIDASGQKVGEQVVSAQQGFNSTQVSMRTLRPGLYRLKISFGGESFVEEVVVK